MAGGVNDIIKVEIEGDIALLTLNRPEKRNAVNDDVIAAFDHFFTQPPQGVHAVVLRGAGGHFCAGLDLAEHEQREAIDGAYHSRDWHRVSNLIEFGPLPVISVLNGAVMGGGLEIAVSTHVRIVEPDVRFQLPEGRRGIFVGGGAAVRIGRILGADRLREMMLTGRCYGAQDGVSLGLAHYSVESGEGLTLARRLARQVADNAPFSNYLMMQALPRIESMSREDGLFTESLATALSQTSEGAKEGLRAFLEKRPPKFR